MKLTLSLSELLLLVALAALSGYVAHGYLATPGAARAEVAPLARAEPALPPGSAALSSKGSSPASDPDPVQTADRPEAEARVGEPAPDMGLEGTGRLRIEPDDGAGAVDLVGDSRGLDPNYEAYLRDLEAQEQTEDLFEEVPEDVFELDDEAEDEAADPDAYNDYLSGIAERAEQRRLEREEQRID